MTRNIFIFLGTFVVGALIALVVRAAAFKPHAEHQGHPAGGGNYAGMVSNPLAPGNTGTTKAAAPSPVPAATNAPVSDAHAKHGVSSASKTDEKPVNTVCAICGMEVDPNLPTMEYQGKKIGFGCRMCAPKVKADPDRYGPFYLRNEIIKK